MGYYDDEMTPEELQRIEKIIDDYLVRTGIYRYFIWKDEKVDRTRLEFVIRGKRLFSLPWFGTFLNIK